MAFIPLQGFQSNLASILLNTATQMALPAADVSYIAANVGVGNYTILGISDGVSTHFEIVNVTGVLGGAVLINRAQEGTIARTFGVGAVVRFIWTTLGIQQVSGPGSAVTVAGTGAAVVTGGPAYNVNVVVPTFTAGTGIGLVGTYPSAITITNTAPATPGPPTVVAGTGVVTVTPIVGGYNVNVPATTVTAGLGISVAGTFPNFVITNTATGGGTGTVTGVTAGTGIVITGTPTIAPIIGLANSGVVAGVYGGLTVNAQGQITNMGAGLITSVTSLTTSLVVGTPAIGQVQLTQGAATIGAPGIVQLAAATAAASNNAGDATSAVTPAGINAVVATLVGANVAAFGQQTALAPASYTTAIAGFTSVITVATGKKALVDVYVEVVDTVTPTNVSSFAVALFNGASLIDGVSTIPSALRKISTILTGPFTGTLSVSTTTLAVTESVSSYYATVTYT